MRIRTTVSAITTSVLLLAGCQTGSEPPGIATAAGRDPGASPNASLAPIDAKREWAQCMRDNGFEMPDPDPEQGKFTDFDWPGKGSAEAALFEQAEGECGAFDTVSGSGEAPKPMGPEQLEAWRDWAQCMRDNGVDTPDPEPYTGFDDPSPSRRDPGASQSGPPAAVVEAAEQACLDKMLAARGLGG